MSKDMSNQDIIDYEGGDYAKIIDNYTLHEILAAIAARAKNGGGGGGTSDFDQLSNRPKYNGTAMTGETNIPLAPSVVQTTGTSQTDVMSQNAVSGLLGRPIELTSADYNWPTTGTKTAIASWLLPDGYYHVSENNVTVKWNTGEGDTSPTFVKGTSPSNSDTLIIKWNGWTAGTYATTTNGARRAASTFSNMQDVKDSLTSTSTIYPLSANQGRVLKNLIDGLVISGAGAPTTATIGVVGTLYEDTTNGKLYQCTAIDTTDPNAPVYTWSEVGGGSGSTVVQTTGTSTTDVMSQNAVTSMIYQDPSTAKNIVIGSGSGTGDQGVSIGLGAVGNSQYGIAIGRMASSYGTSPVALGAWAQVKGSTQYGVALGWGARVDIGRKGCVALGAEANPSRDGEVNIGSGTTVGFNNTKFRVIGGVHDGEQLHDAATVAQGNTLATSAPTTSTEGVLGQLYTDTTNMHTYQCTAIDTTDPDNPSYTWTQRW